MTGDPELTIAYRQPDDRYVDTTNLPVTVDAVTAAATVALDTRHLRAQAKDRLAELRASRKGSSPSATPNGDGSSAASTTAPGSGWWRRPCNCR